MGWHGPLAGAVAALGTGWGGNECKFWQEVVLPRAGSTYHDLAGEQDQAGTPGHWQVCTCPPASGMELRLHEHPTSTWRFPSSLERNMQISLVSEVLYAN